MKNKKLIAIIIGVLFIISIVLGMVGLLESKRKTSEVPQKNYQVTYKYYLNDVEVAQMPTNPKLIVDEGSSVASSTQITAEKLYAFNTASCTNNVTYTWNDETWTFTPSNTADSTCSIYFVTTYNTVKIEIKNAKITSPDEMKVKRAEDAVVKITPDEGYSFEEAKCTNNEVVQWDKDANELIIRNVTLETTCKVTFAISKFTVETQVNMGTGTTSVEYEYGKKVDIKVIPAEDYGNPDIACTSDQKATWKDETLTIEKLTNSTKCTVTFKKLQTKTEYTVTLDVGDHGTIISGKNPETVLSGGSVNWNVKPSDGYEIISLTCTAGNGDAKATDNDYIISIKSITEDTTCSVIYKQVE